MGHVSHLHSRHGQCRGHGELLNLAERAPCPVPREEGDLQDQLVCLQILPLPKFESPVLMPSPGLGTSVL
jgi:hypothetical protein